MYRFLLSRQWVILTLVGLLLMPTMYKLGFWQLHRHERKVADNTLIANSLHAPPVPVERLTAPGATVAAHDNFRTVTAAGRYDPAHQVVVRHRTSGDDSTIGYYVLTPLVLTDGKAVLVNRGWIPASGDLTALPHIPATPTGQVRITGRLRPDETTASTGIRDTPGLPPHQVMLINSRQQARDLPEPLLGGYIEVTATTPAPPAGQPQAVPAPDDSSIGPHLAYAIQWWLFTAMVPVGWVILVRRERKERLAQQTAAPAAGDGPAPDGGTPDPEDPGAAGAEGTGSLATGTAARD